jgi:2,3-dihydroxybiphenyl 1,2-dioxygenase
MNIACLGYIGISASDPAAWRTLLHDVIGMMDGAPDGDAVRMRMDEQSWRIAVESGEQDDLAYAGFEVAETAGLEVIRQRLASIGVQTVDGDAELCARRGVMGLIHCTDPAGLRVEIYFGPNMLTDQPFRSPAGVSRFVTGEQGLGHIFLNAPDLTELRKFYTSGMGFKLSDIIHMPLDPTTPNISVDLEFYHCNPRHHSIGMAPGDGGKRLHHFMLEAPALDDVGFALDRAQNAGVPVPVLLGRHSNDLVTSFYMVSPSNFAIEFGCGGVAIDENWRLARHTTPSSWGHRGLGGR